MTSQRCPPYNDVMKALQANGFTVVESRNGNGDLVVSINGLPIMTPQDAVTYGFQQLQALNVPGAGSGQ